MFRDTREAMEKHELHTPISTYNVSNQNPPNLASRTVPSPLMPLTCGPVCGRPGALPTLLLLPLGRFPPRVRPGLLLA